MYVFPYVVRRRCDCGFIWTIPGSDSIICACGATAISQGVGRGQDLAFTEPEFTQACANEIGVDPGQVQTVPA